MPYPAPRRSRAELTLSAANNVITDPDDEGALMVRYLSVEGLEAVRNRVAWVRVTRWSLAMWLRCFPFPDDLKAAVEQVAAYLDYGS
jgi:hypothetical protein